MAHLALVRVFFAGTLLTGCTGNPLAGGDSDQTYVDPGKPGRNEVHFTFFDGKGDELGLPKTREICLNLIIAGSKFEHGVTSILFSHRHSRHAGVRLASMGAAPGLMVRIMCLRS